MNERLRLNDRIHSISGTPLAREFATYRKIINKPREITNRNVTHSVVTFNNRIFIEASDALTLMH
jgi:hypothetical protein